MTARLKLRFRDRAAVCAYVVIAAFVAALLWPLVCGGRLYWGDIGVYFGPMADYLQTSLKAGRIPLWNPYVLGGQPFVGNPQMAVFYPNTLLLYVMPAWAALSLALGIHLFLCGAFTFAYLRRWTESDVSAMAGGITYAGSACLIGRMQFPPMVCSAAYLPLLLLLIDRQIERPALKTCLLLAVSFGLMLLAAHTQMAYFEILLSAAYLGTRLFRHYKNEKIAMEFPDGAARRRWLVRTSAPFFMSGLLGVWLCAAQVVPAAQLLGESPRERMTAVQANRFFLEARQLLTLVFPHFTGHPANGDYHAAGNAWEPALFIGWIPLVLIAIAVKDWRHRKVRYALILSGTGIWLAFGIKGGLYQIAFALVPGLSKFHDPARFLYFTTFGFALLSAFGMDKMRRVSGVGVREWVARWRLGSDSLLLAGIALPLIIYGRDWNPTTKPKAALTAQRSGFPTPIANALPIPEPRYPTPAATGRVYLPEYQALWDRYISYYDFGRNDARTMRAFSDTLMPNTNMNARIESLAGYEPVPLYAPFALEGLAGTQLLRGEPNATNLMAMLNANTIVTPTSWNLPEPRLIPLDGGRASGGMKRYANRDALPRFWLVRHTRRIEGRTRILASLSDPAFNPASEAVISCGLNDELAEKTSGTNWNFGTASADFRAQNNADAPDVLGADRLAERPTDRAFTARNTPDAVSFTGPIDAGGRPAYLVASLMAYPGWQAVVDGRTEIPLRTDGALMGIPLEPGTHQVTFRYNPSAYRIGLYLSLLACGVVSLGIGYLIAARSRGIRS